MFEKLFGSYSGGGRSPEEQEALRLVDGYLKDLKGLKWWMASGPSDIKLSEYTHGKRIQDAGLPEQLAVVHAAMDRMLKWGHRRSGNWKEVAQLSWLITKLVRKKLPVSEDDLVRMADAAVQAEGACLSQWPLGGLLGLIEKFVESHGLSDRLGKSLDSLAAVTGGADRSELRMHAPRIAKILGGTGDKIALVPSEWGRSATASLETQDEPIRIRWVALLNHASTAAGKSSPAAQWLDEAGPLVSAVGSDNFREAMSGWLDSMKLDPHDPDPNSDIVKGLIWASGTLGDDSLAPDVGRFCERCFKKVPGVGPPAMKLGNSCITALGAMSGDRAVAQLVRLRGRIKQAQPKERIEKALGEAAARAGLTVADLEEIALPAFGLDADGRRQVALGDVTAEIRITGSDDVALNWTGADGKPRKSVPASVKADHADELKALRAETKEIKGLLSGQRWRLESLYLQGRSWPLEQWRTRYLEHPLMANLARRLIWNFGEVAAIPVGDAFVGRDGKPIDMAANAAVSLWHPIESDADTVLEWRRRLAALDVVQPFKQAHREIYLLTDAERATEIYSNRFAAHILRQHQMNALCRARGWQYALQGAWDQEESVPTLYLPGGGCAQFWVDYASDDYLDSGIYIYRATDQVRFNDGDGEAMRLDDVPRLVFSEVMRDVDLFVGVASVGNNPEWQDGGPEGRFRDYWWSFSFGDLSETANTRRDVLQDLLPRLKISGQCELKDRFLIVRGTRRTYKIHLGSSNILMAPNDEYLCIVPDGSNAVKGGANVRLPFEGDRTLSLILSKAFLLAADDKINDKTILSQIGR